MDQVPTSVTAAAKKAFPDVKFTKAGYDPMGNYYQLHAMDRSKQDVEFVADEKVSLTTSTIDTPLSVDQLPGPIRAAHLKLMNNKFNKEERFDAIKIVRADRTRSFADTPEVEKKSWYEFYGKNRKGEMMMDFMSSEGGGVLFRRQTGNVAPKEQAKNSTTKGS